MCDRRKFNMFRPSIVSALAMFVYCADAKQMTEIEALASNPTKCIYETAYDMYGAYCAGLRLTKIPSLSGSIEILQFSDNKLRVLNGETLSYYSNIKFLYLADNQIYQIDSNAFDYLYYLETLDLSRNVIIDLPISIFQLKSLRNLYLSGNPINVIDSTQLTGLKPVKAPLELLDFSDCRINVLPELGILPQLKIYNVSQNPLTKLEAQQFAGMCNLQNLDLTGSIDGIRLCEMSSAIWWLQDNHMRFQLDDYSKLNSKEFERCPKVNNVESQILNSTYTACKKEPFEVSRVMRTSKKKWVTVTGGLGGFLVSFILLLYLVHRINVAKSKSRNAVKAKHPIGTADGDKQATAVLLNDI